MQADTPQSPLPIESEIRKLIDSDLMGICIPDRFGAFLEANDELLRITGYTRDDLRAGRMRWDIMTPPEYRELDQTHIAEAAKFGNCTPYEKEYIRKDGVRVPIFLSYALLEGSNDKYIAFIQDLTFQDRAASRLRDALRRNKELAESVEIEGVFGRVVQSVLGGMREQLDSEINHQNRTPAHIVRQPHLSELKRLTDDQLMVQLQSGVNDALALLFERYHRLVFSVALKILHDRGEAEDVMQNVFLEIYRAVAQFDPAKGSLKVWLLQYAYHRSLSRKQYLSARSFYSQENIDDLDPFSGGEFTSRMYSPGELRLLLKQGLASLGKSQKRVVELASFEGFSMQEIADKTGDSLSNVRHHYYRGLQKLRSFITLTNSPKTRSNNE